MATIHIICWSLLLCSPLMFANSFRRTFVFSDYLLFIVMPLAHMIVFYTNYFLFINKLLFKNHLGRFLLYNVILIIVVSLGIHLWHVTFEFREIPPRPNPVFLWLLKDSLMLILTAGLSVAIKVTANWYKTERERQEIEKEKTAAELKNLKNQLNPHFLFNSLNNIYSLVSLNPGQAQYAILSLSQLLRYVLYDNNQSTLPLSKELSFVKSYIELMTLRLSEKVKLTVIIPNPDAGKGLLIAPLLFITLIENAFKHGVSPVEESHINILIELKNSNIITCKIENSYYPKSDHDRSGSGIGLNNLTKRLNLIYPDKYSLISKKDGNIYISQLTITL